MDSRDIKLEPDKVENNQYLEKIYELQKNLLEGYIGIEGLPQYPININSKKSQILIKDFVGRVIEELAEGYESLLMALELTNKNKLWLSDYNDSDLLQTLNHIQNAGEEMADAMHFMIELLIYSNIYPEDIKSYINQKYTKEEGNGIIDLCMSIGNYFTNSTDNEICCGINILNIVKDDEDLPKEIKSQDFRLLKCGVEIGNNIYEKYKPIIWDVTYHLNIARNYLKNKPWKQSQEMTNEEKYQEEIVLAFIYMMGLFYKMGINQEDLYLLYFKKNQVNLFRQKSNY